MNRLAFALVLLSACAPTRGPSGEGGSGQFAGLTWGYYFGNCWGDCLAEIVLEEDGSFTGRRYGQDGLEYLTAAGTTRELWFETLDSTWEELDRGALEEVYGCPDCADGGGEYFIYGDGQSPERSDWQYSQPPAELAPLQQQMSQLWSDISGCGTSQAVAAYTNCEWQDVPIGR